MKRSGFLIDRGARLELRGGDILTMYVSMGGFDKWKISIDRFKIINNNCYHIYKLFDITFSYNLFISMTESKKPSFLPDIDMRPIKKSFLSISVEEIESNNKEQDHSVQYNGTSTVIYEFKIDGMTCVACS